MLENTLPCHVCDLSGVVRNDPGPSVPRHACLELYTEILSPPTRPHSSAHRPWSVSMLLTATADRDRQHRQPQKGCPATRVLGDYTLTKPPGAGSMGKLKFAIRNLTDEGAQPSPLLSPPTHLSLAGHRHPPPASTHPRPCPMVQIRPQWPSLNRPNSDRDG